MEFRNVQSPQINIHSCDSRCISDAGKTWHVDCYSGYANKTNKEKLMESNYDEKELLPLLLPSTCHPERTVKCNITSHDDHAGTKLASIVNAKYGGAHLPNEMMLVHFSGEAGDYFGSGLVSGMTFVVDSIGSHGCSEMHGGLVVILDEPGDEFAEGIQGGCAYVYDSDGTLSSHCGNVAMEHISASSDEAEFLKSIVEEQAIMTGSARARALVSEWPKALSRFVKVTAA